MNLSPVSATLLFSFIIFWNPILASVKGPDNPAPYYTGDVAINCGYVGNSRAHDGRQWFGDAGSRSVVSMLQPRGKSTSSTADHKSLSADPIPYMTARVSATQFYYIFQVNPGQKFIRLHFYPSSYPGFENSQDFFTVKSGPFTLLRNFSASFAADAMGVRYIVKEFCLNVEEDKYLDLTFSPSSRSTKKRNLYAFVNGIEIISMPIGLYYTPDDDLGVRIVGQNNRYIVENSTALEMVQRLNIGGSSISPVEDFGMYRRWTKDANYLLESKLQPVNHLVNGIKYTGLPEVPALLKIYHTSWKTGKQGRADKMQNFTWKIPVDLGFGYLVRLHFFDFGLGVTESGRREFNVLIKNQIAEVKANLIRLSAGTGVPIHRDYMVVVKGDTEADKFDLFIILQSSDESVIGLLRGLEIFKLSNPDNNLASPNNAYLKQVSTSWNPRIQTLLFASGRKNVIVTGITILLILLNLIVFRLNQIQAETCHGEKDNRSALSKQSCCRFSIAEIISATQNFSEAFLIGRGGFGNVYKGFIGKSSKIVAVKRLKSNSNQGAREFWTEILTLSKIRHINVVSLIGYCNEDQEMILVSEYMPCGTLADNVYKIGRNGMNNTPLTWKQRLRICIGAARGLDYVHTGIENGVIHGDVKASNILLDRNLVAKVSDFGLSRVGNVSESQGNLSTEVEGSDPNHISCHNPTRETDIYSFGIVMLVVLCGRPAVDRSIPQTLLFLFQESMKRGDVSDIVDPSMQGKISSMSLNEFIRSVQQCLEPQAEKRPTMSQLVTSLEYALELHQSAVSSESAEGIMSKFQSNEFSVPPVVQERDVCTSEEGLTSLPIDSAELEGIRKDLPSGEKDCTSAIRRPEVRPWEAFRKIGNRLKKRNLFSEDEPTSRFTISEIQAATDNFSPHRMIVNNTFWMGYVGFMKSLQKRCIIYKFKAKVCDEDFEKFSNELELLLQKRHRNLLSMVGYCYHESRVFIVHEYFGRNTQLYDTGNVPLSWIVGILNQTH